MFRRALNILLLAAALAALAAMSGCGSSMVVKGADESAPVSAEGGPVYLVGVDATDDGIAFRMSSEFPGQYTLYKPSDPFTVVLELPGIEKADSVTDIAVNKRTVNDIKFRMMDEPNRFLRVEITLGVPAEVEGAKEGNAIVLKVKDESTAGQPATEAAAPAPVSIAASQPMPAEQPAAPATEPVAAPEAVEAPIEAASAVTGIDFSYKEGKLMLNIRGNGAMKPDIFTLDKRIVIDLPFVRMDAEMPKKMVSPIRGVRQGKYNDKIRLVLDLEKDVEFMASTGRDVVIVAIPVRDAEAAAVAKEVAKTTEAAALAPETAAVAEAEKPAVVSTGEAAPVMEAAEPAKKYKGQLVTIDFQDADVVPIFRFLGEIGGFNVVIHPDVKGKITIMLKDVPWEQALDIILSQMSLGKSIEVNILSIAPNDFFSKQAEEKSKFQQARVKADELVQVSIHLDHMAALDFKKRLEEAKALSPRGTTRIDERTNTIIINDTQEYIDKIRRDELDYWDTAEHGTMQVLIEAKIVEVSSDVSDVFGIYWSGNKGTVASPDGSSNFASNPNSTSFGVNVPIALGGGASLAVGYADEWNVNIAIGAVETMRKGKHLANPKVLTIDKMKAKIEQGVQIPFTAAAEGGGTTIEFKSATLSLDVTPEIQPNGVLMLLVDAKNDSPSQIFGEVAISSQSVKTQALVRDGQTLVLGGIYKNDDTKSEVRVPILSRIPLLGWLFKYQETTKATSELLIFITPKIVKPLNKSLI